MTEGTRMADDPYWNKAKFHAPSNIKGKHFSPLCGNRRASAMVLPVEKYKENPDLVTCKKCQEYSYK